MICVARSDIIRALKIFFKLVGNCFTMLCWYLLYNYVTQLYVYMHPLPHESSSYCSLLPPTPSHTSRSSQSTKLSFLCYTTATHQFVAVQSLSHI